MEKGADRQACEASFDELERLAETAGASVYARMVQEKENLDFLITQAELYKGDDFVLAARREKNTLICLEILGNTTAAPMIIHTLGCKDGKFRTCPTSNENSRPFTMYLPFTPEKPPSYFGLAFD